MFLTNNSPNLCVLTLCIMFRKDHFVFSTAAKIISEWNKNYRRYNFQALANISRNFRKI